MAKKKAKASTKKRRFIRPDFSDYVVHFTKDAAPITNANETVAALKKIAPQSAKDRLYSILKSGKLYSTRMPWTNRPAICFTECTWSSLLDHASRYSKYGLGFSKDYLFSRGGGPAIYLPPGLLEHQKSHTNGSAGSPLAPELWSFVTPFCPPYAPQKYKERFWKNRKAIDYSHEREWRVPHDLDFDLRHVKFVVVATYDDMAKAPKRLKDEVGRDNWLIMENYEKVETLWPVHQVPN